MIRSKAWFQISAIGFLIGFAIMELVGLNQSLPAAFGAGLAWAIGERLRRLGK